MWFIQCSYEINGVDCQLRRLTLRRGRQVTGAAGRRRVDMMQILTLYSWEDYEILTLKIGKQRRRCHCSKTLGLGD